METPIATEMKSLFFEACRSLISRNADATTSGFTDTITTSDLSTTGLFSKIAVAPKP